MLVPRVFRALVSYLRCSVYEGVHAREGDEDGVRTHHGAIWRVGRLAVGDGWHMEVSLMAVERIIYICNKL